jgi:hypothetical protein
VSVTQGRRARRIGRSTDRHARRRRIGVCGARAAAFVGRLLDAHARQLATVRPIEHVLRSHDGRRFAAPTVGNAPAYFQLSLVTRLSLALQRHAAPPSIVVPAAGGTTAERERLVVTPRLSPVVLERLFSREQRVESRAFERTAPQTDPARGSPAWQQPPAVAPGAVRELVVRRAARPERVEPQRRASVDTAGPNPAAAGPAVRAALEQALRPSSVAAPIPLSRSELTRLTDQVVEVLDRRIVSYRERMGAIR